MENQIVIQAKNNLKDIENLKSQIDEIGKNCQQITVTDEVSLAICQQNIAKANNMLNLIEAKHKEIKAPFLEAGRLCDNTKKALTEKLEVNQITPELAEAQVKALKEESAISATKNIRWIPDFELVDITQVPKEWLCLNEEVVKAYMKTIKDDLTPEGKVENGVKFYKKMSVIS